MEEKASIRGLSVTSRLSDPPKFQRAQRSHSEQLPADQFSRHLAVGREVGEKETGKEMEGGRKEE